jgi:hypothetical protein
MTITNIITTFDKFALGLFHTLVLGGLPLVAIGVIAQSVYH